MKTKSKIGRLIIRSPNYQKSKFNISKRIELTNKD